ncbi:hypothetical protein niasHT_004917 [Heterodera trifolii]|uniref:Regulatory protein zeste n=1 Tax=Heterodera trifolii TaxID=157864 RepID=A0ABD2M1U3_9BILA
MSQRQNQSRLIVAQLCRERKHILFGAFSPQLTKKIKEQCWEEVRELAVASGCEKLAGKPWTFVRDCIWGASKRDALHKRDIQRKSGEGAVNFTEVDEIVFDVIGKDSAVVDGLEVASDDDDNWKKDQQQIVTKNEFGSGSSRSTFSTPFRKMKPRGRAASDTDSGSELDIEIKKAKLRLLDEQLETQRLTNYKLRQEIGSMSGSRPSSCESLAIGFGGLNASLEPSNSSKNASQELEMLRRNEDELFTLEKMT